MKPVTCTVQLESFSTGCAIRLPFAPKEHFGRVRAPVVVTIGRYSFRTTIAAMSGECWIVVNKANREGAGVKAGDTIKVKIALDTAPRIITPPADLKRLLAADAAAKAAWNKLSYTHQREYVRWIEEAKRSGTREKRLRETIDKLRTKK